VWFVVIVDLAYVEFAISEVNALYAGQAQESLVIGTFAFTYIFVLAALAFSDPVREVTKAVLLQDGANTSLPGWIVCVFAISCDVFLLPPELLLGVCQLPFPNGKLAL